MKRIAAFLLGFALTLPALIALRKPCDYCGGQAGSEGTGCDEED